MSDVTDIETELVAADGDAPMREDVFAWPIILQLADELEAEFTASNLDMPSIEIRPGSQVQDDRFLDGDDCDGGLLSIRLVDIFQASNFPAIDSSTLNAYKVQIGFDLEIRCMRCFDVGDGGSATSPYEWMRVSRQQIADAAAMRRAICKVMGAAGRDWLLRSYTPYGPQGGIVGGSWPVAIRGRKN